MTAIPVHRLVQIVYEHPGITTPEFAEKLQVGIAFARWAVLESGVLEFYDGNHIRLKEGVKA